MAKNQKIDDHSLNSLLSEIELAADDATAGLQILKTVAPYPVGTPQFGLVCTVANDAVKAALAFLATPNPSALAIAAKLQALGERVGGILSDSETAETKKTTGRSLANYAGWGMLTDLGAEDMSPAAMIVAGLLILQAAHHERPIPKALANHVRKNGPSCDLAPKSLRVLLKSGIDAEDTQWPWLAGIQSRWAHLLNLLTVGGVAPPPPGFNRRARGQVFARQHKFDTSCT